MVVPLEPRKLLFFVFFFNQKRFYVLYAHGENNTCCAHSSALPLNFPPLINTQRSALKSAQSSPLLPADVLENSASGRRRTHRQGTTHTARQATHTQAGYTQPGRVHTPRQGTHTKAGYTHPGRVLHTQAGYTHPCCCRTFRHTMPLTIQIYKLPDSL